MKKAIIVLLTVLLTLSVFVACDEDNMIDEKFTSTITFDANGGEGEMKAQVVVSNTPVKLAENTFTKEDFHFHGWSTNPDGTGTTYGDGEEITVTGSITLYAIWNHDMAIISFNANGGEGLMKLQYVKTNTPTALRANEFTREGYEFMYWTTEASGEGHTYGDEAKISTSGNVTLYAQWKQDTVAVTFHANNGSDPEVTKVQNVEVNVATDLAANTFTKTGYHFAGWAETATGEKKYDNGASIKTSVAVNLYALWEADTTVTFYKNDGSTTTTTQPIPSNTETALTKNSFSRTGYVFLCWNDKADGSGTDYADEQKVTLTEDLKLYAQWAVDLYTTTLSKTDWNVSNSKFYTLTGDTTISNRITVTGSITLILPEGKTLTASKGITVTGTNSLTINGKGSLSAGGSETTPSGAAGIGGVNESDKKNAGTITINGGTVTATGGNNAAGIGGGLSGEGGDVTINGGTVTANGGNSGAGIGGGYEGVGGTVTINGGTVTATGGGYAAGIGGGKSGAGGNVTITGGTVTATGGTADIGYSDAAGIGAGSASSSSPSPSHGTLTIGAGCALTGGSASVDTVLLGPVDIKTDYTGSHPRYMNVSTVSEIKDSTSAITLKSGVYTTDKTDNEVVVDERITIEGSVFLLLRDGKTLTAKKGITVSSENTLVIDKYGSGATGTGILNATGPVNFAGIGGDTTNITAGTIIINNGEITANGGKDGAGIGGGKQGSGGTVTINGGTVEATGGQNGAGIGGGYQGSGGEVTITGGTVTATSVYGGAGIGGGHSGAGGEISIKGGTVTATGGPMAAGIGGGSGIDGGIITIKGGKVTATGGSGAAGIGGGFNANSGNITIEKVGTAAPVVYAKAGADGPNGIGCGVGTSTISTNINLIGVTTLQRSYNGTDWTASDGSPSQRDVYMRTEGAVPPTT